MEDLHLSVRLQATSPINSTTWSSILVEYDTSTCGSNIDSDICGQIAEQKVLKAFHDYM